MTIRDITSIQDGEMRLLLSNGRQVSSYEIAYANEGEAALYQTIADMQPSPEAAKCFLKAYKAKSGPAAAEFAYALREAFQYGQENKPQSTLKYTPHASKLSPGQRDYAYRRGLDVGSQHNTSQNEASLAYEDNQTVEAQDDTIRISSPGSTQSYKRSLLAIAAGKAGLDKRRSNILKGLKKKGDYQRFPVNSVTTRDLAYLSAAAGVEFALFRGKREDILVRGDYRNCDISGALGEEIIRSGYEWIAHSHVDGGTLTPSLADREALRLLNQQVSILIGIDGRETRFTQSEFGD